MGSGCRAEQGREGVKLVSLWVRQVAFGVEPKLAGPFERVIIGFQQSFVLLASHLIDPFVEVLGDMKLVKHDVGLETRIRARVPRCDCQQCGVKTTAVAWAGRNSRLPDLPYRKY